MNEQRQALLDALGEARLPTGTLSWPAIALAACALALLAVLGALWLRRTLRQRRARAAARAWLPEARAALARLDTRADQADRVARAAGAAPSETEVAEQQRDWMAEAARLARRVALVSEARDSIAPLHGDAWLQRLDALVGRPLFSVAPVNALASAPYRAAAGLPPGTLAATRTALERLIEAIEQRTSSAVPTHGTDPARR